MKWVICEGVCAPINPSTGWPLENANTAGIDWTRSWPATFGFLSMSIFTKLIFLWFSFITDSKIGPSVLHGPHCSTRPDIEVHFGIVLGLHWPNLTDQCNSNNSFVSKFVRVCSVHVSKVLSHMNGFYSAKCIQVHTYTPTYSYTHTNYGPMLMP